MHDQIVYHTDANIQQILCQNRGIHIISQFSARLAFNINCSNLESRNIFEAKTTFLNSGNRAITSTINERQRISGISLLNVRAE